MMRCGSHGALLRAVGAVLHYRLRYSTSSSRDDATRGGDRAEQQSHGDVAAGTTKVKPTTAAERHEMRANWERAFFARVNYDPKARRRFAAAMAERDAEMDGGGTAGPASRAGKTEEPFPPWPVDAPAPRREFLRLRPALQARYLLDRLAWAERRVLYAEDYGGLFIMQFLNDAEMTLTDCEELLRELDWMNEEIEERVELVRKMITKIKYDNDLI